MALEVEMKFPIDDPAAVGARLAEAGIVLGEPVAQIDEYFQHPSRDFAATDEAFRLRRIADAAFVTYKGPKLDAQTKTREEIEVPLAPGSEPWEQFTAMLLHLGFLPAGTVVKERRTGRAFNHGREIEVAWDAIVLLGEFLELEVVAEADEADAARDAVQALAASLGLTHSERRSYLELLRAAEKSRKPA